MKVQWGYLPHALVSMSREQRSYANSRCHLTYPMSKADRHCHLTSLEGSGLLRQGLSARIHEGSLAG